MTGREYVAITVSKPCPVNGWLTVDGVYLVAVDASGGNAVRVAMRIFESHRGRQAEGVEVVYEDVTDCPELLERRDVTWLTPRAAPSGGKPARGVGRPARRREPA